MPPTFKPCLIALDRTEDGFVEVVFEVNGRELCRTVTDLNDREDCQFVVFLWWVQNFRRYC